MLKFIFRRKVRNLAGTVGDFLPSLIAVVGMTRTPAAASVFFCGELQLCLQTGAKPRLEKHLGKAAPACGADLQDILLVLISRPAHTPRMAKHPFFTSHQNPPPKPKPNPKQVATHLKLPVQSSTAETVSWESCFPPGPAPGFGPCCRLR